MNLVLKDIRRNPLLWLLVFVPVLFLAAKLRPGSHTMLFMLSVLAIVPLAALLSHATESVAAKTGDAVGGLLNATLGNLTELVIALTALAGRRLRTCEGVDRGSHRRQYAVHAWRIVAAGRPQAPHPGIQPRGCTPAGQLAVPGNDRAAHPVPRRHGRYQDDGDIRARAEPWARPTSHCRHTDSACCFRSERIGSFSRASITARPGTTKSLGLWDLRSACWRS